MLILINFIEKDFLIFAIENMCEKLEIKKKINILVSNIKT
jgi:hypothetical protein